MTVYQYCEDKNNPLMDKVVTLIEGIEQGGDVLQDDIGQELDPKPAGRREVYADFFGISQNENFKAGQSGYSPQLGVLIYLDEFSGEEKLQIEETFFRVYRNYPRGDGIIELYCEAD